MKVSEKGRPHSSPGGRAAAVGGTGEPTDRAHFKPGPPAVPLRLVPLPSSKARGSHSCVTLSECRVDAVEHRLESGDSSQVQATPQAQAADGAHPMRRSVAVQARAIRGDESAGANHGHESCWVGGVRALRDSHVRLVLRQLRHVARLNRTLDRALTAP